MSTLIKDKQQTISGDFVLLSTQHTHLLLPQQQVGNAQYLSPDIQWLAINDDINGNHFHNTQGIFYQNKTYAMHEPNYFFIALSEQLKPIPTGIKDRFIAVPLADTHQPNNQILWCWHSAKILTDVSFVTHPLPESIMAPNSPIEAYIAYEDDIIYPCHSTQLIDYALNR